MPSARVFIEYPEGQEQVPVRGFGNLQCDQLVREYIHPNAEGPEAEGVDDSSVAQRAYHVTF